MSFVFVSHAQPDKLRPDGRMRALIHFLHAAGIPLWIDRPEELGLDPRLLQDRCIAINGFWTADIRKAIAECAGGIGVVSLHSAYRLSEDPAGVLFQELNGLSLRDRLFLLKIDPGIQDGDPAFGSLMKGQQALDLATPDTESFKRRVIRLVEELSRLTGVKAHIVRPYLTAMSGKSSGGGGLGALFQQDSKAAATAASSLLSAFRTHDPGRLPAVLTPALAASLEYQVDACRRANVRFRSFHRLLALMKVSGFVPSCFDQLRSGLGLQVETWLLAQAQKQAERERDGFVGLDLSRDQVVAAAAALAEAERCRHVDERHLFIAILQDEGSATVTALTDSIKQAGLDDLMRIAAARRSGSSPFSATTPLDGL